MQAIEPIHSVPKEARVYEGVGSGNMPSKESKGFSDVQTECQEIETSEMSIKRTYMPKEGAFWANTEHTVYWTSIL